MSDRKRACPQSPDVDEHSLVPDGLNNSRYLVISHQQQDQTLAKVSPFLIDKALQACAGSLDSVKKLRNGTLLVETRTAQQTTNLLRLKTLGNVVPISVSPHPRLNVSKGVVFCHDLLDSSPDDIKQELSRYKVTDVTRMFRTENGTRVPTSSLILTFATPDLPASVRLGYLQLNVRRYYPRPLRCFNCQKYGHGSSSCTYTAACVRCGSTQHSRDVCQQPELCARL